MSDMRVSSAGSRAGGGIGAGTPHHDHDHIFTAGSPERLDVPFELKSLTTRRAEDGAEAGVFEGLASTFGTLDRIGDVIEPGAFRDSLARPGRVKMLWQHDARAPIGLWERLVETPAGLAVKGRLILEVQRAREAQALLRAGAVDALSIGFSVPRGGAAFDRETSLRRLKRIDLWEVSIVTFPANPEARVARIKSRPRAQLTARGGGLPSEREFERYLTREAGFSRSQARTIVGAGYKALIAGAESSGRDAGQGSGANPGDLDDLAARLRRVAGLVAAGSPTSNQRAGD